jgi:hypothetical protein
VFVTDGRKGILNLELGPRGLRRSEIKLVWNLSGTNLHNRNP